MRVISNVERLSKFQITLTPALSHEYVGEEGKAKTRFNNRALSKWGHLRFRARLTKQEASLVQGGLCIQPTPIYPTTQRDYTNAESPPPK